MRSIMLTGPTLALRTDTGFVGIGRPDAHSHGDRGVCLRSTPGNELRARPHQELFPTIGTTALARNRVASMTKILSIGPLSTGQ